MKQKEKTAISIEDVIENFTTITEWKEEENAPIGVVKNNIVVLDDEEFPYKDIVWLSEDNIEELFPHIKENYEVLLSYLKEINTDTNIDWEDQELVCGLKSILMVSAEAAHKIDNFLSKLKNVKIEKITKSQLYQHILSVYANDIQKKMPEGEWEDNWSENEPSVSLDLEKTGLNNFETLKKDEHYELFYLVDEEEKPLFSQALLSNVKFSCDYNEALKKEDPLLQIKLFQDKDLSGLASFILKEMKPILKRYFKQEIFKRRDKLTIALNNALFALMLTANSRNLLINTEGKCASKYFYDFTIFLKTVFLSDGYRYHLENSEKEDSRDILSIIHTLSRNLFLRPNSIREELLGYIHKLVREGVKEKQHISKNIPIWEKILKDDGQMRDFFSQFPNGPLFKILDVIREKEEGKDILFEPFLQQNMPSMLFSCEVIKKQVNMLHLPCPTRQHFIFKAHICDEFLALVRSFSRDTLLLINLQDRSSFLEYARCHVIEELQNEIEFHDKITTITLDCHSNFYFQTNNYFSLDNANEFIEEFKKSLNGDGYFYFPKKLHIIDMATPILSFIHKEFFDNKITLVRQERLDFIEIFYFFITIKLLEVLDVSFAAFVCKDGVDISSCKNGFFYAASKILQKHILENEDIENFLLFVYSPALLVRERLVDSQRLNRTISALQYFSHIISNKKIHLP